MADKYFLYSKEQFEEKNEILKKSNKKFVAGVVVVGGEKKSFTVLSDKSTIPRFIDTKIVLQGDPKDYVYTMPKTVKERRSG